MINALITEKPRQTNAHILLLYVALTGHTKVDFCALPSTVPDLSLCQGHTIWVTVALQYILKSGSVRPQAYRFQDCFEDWKGSSGIKIP